MAAEQLNKFSSRILDPLAAKAQQWHEFVQSVGNGKVDKDAIGSFVAGVANVAAITDLPGCLQQLPQLVGHVNTAVQCLPKIKEGVDKMSTTLTGVAKGTMVLDWTTAVGLVEAIPGFSGVLSGLAGELLSLASCDMSAILEKCQQKMQEDIRKHEQELAQAQAQVQILKEKQIVAQERVSAFSAHNDGHRIVRQAETSVAVQQELAQKQAELAEAKLALETAQKLQQKLQGKAQAAVVDVVAQLDAASSEVARLQSEVQDLENAIATAQIELQELMMQEAQLQDQLEQTDAELERLNGVIQALHDDINERVQREAELQAEENDINQQIAEAQGQLQKAMNGVRAAVVMQISAMAMIAAGMATMWLFGSGDILVAAGQALKMTADAMLAAFQHQVDVLQKLIAALSNRLQLVQRTRQMNLAMLESSRQTLAETETQRDRVQAQHDDIMQQLENTRDAIDKKQEQISELQAQLDSKMQELAEAQANQQLLEAMHMNTLGNLNASIATTVASCAARVQQLEAAVNGLHLRSQTLASQMESHRQQYASDVHAYGANVADLHKCTMGIARNEERVEYSREVCQFARKHVAEHVVFKEKWQEAKQQCQTKMAEGHQKMMAALPADVRAKIPFGRQATLADNTNALAAGR